MLLGHVMKEAALVGELFLSTPDTSLLEKKAEDLLSDSTKIEQAHVQAKDSSRIANPFNVALETTVSDNLTTGKDKFVKYQKVEIKNTRVSAIYNFHEEKDDVLRVRYNINKDLCVTAYMFGEWNGDDVFRGEIKKRFHLKKGLDLAAEIGLDAGKGTVPKYYSSINLSSERLFFTVTYYDDTLKFSELNEGLFAAVGLDLNKIYLGLGRNGNGNLVGVATLKNLEDVGALGMVIYNTDTKVWLLEAQTGIKNADKFFFSRAISDFILEYFALPRLLDVNLGPQNERGIYSVKIDVIGSPKARMLEAKLGWKNKIIPFSVGIASLTKATGSDGFKEKERELGIAAQIYRPFVFEGVKGYVAAGYNGADNTISGSLVIKLP